VVKDFYPAVGPMSGGSRLTVIGQHLDVGSHVTAMLANEHRGNSTVPCRISGKRFDNMVVCVTDAIAAPSVMSHLVLSIDSAGVNFSRHFTFVPDPVIESIMPFKTIVRYYSYAYLSISE